MLNRIVFISGLLFISSAALAAEAVPPEDEAVPATEPATAAEPTTATEPTPAPAAEPALAPEPMPVPGEVARAQFTTAISDREPVDDVTSIASDIGTVYFFTDLREFAGQTVIHHWLHNGESVAEVAFDVGGPRWRVWSSKNLMTDWVGTWSVEVVAADGSVVASESLQVTAPAKPMQKNETESMESATGEAESEMMKLEGASDEAESTSMDMEENQE